MSLSITGNSVIGWTIVGTFSTAYRDAGYTVTITRYHDGTRSDSINPIAFTVRGADAVDISNTTMFFYDYEAPVGDAFMYYESIDDLSGNHIGGSEVIMNDHVVPTGFAIIHSVLSPSRRAAGAITQFDSWSRETRVLGNHSIIGRRNPVVVDDVLGGIVGTLSMTNINPWDINFDGYGPYEQYAVVDTGLETMFDNGGVFQFRSVYADTGVTDFYFSCTSVNITRLSRVVAWTDPQMKQYDIQFTEVDMPRASLTAGAFMSWDDVQARVDAITPSANWSLVASTFTNWENVQQGDLADDI